MLYWLAHGKSCLLYTSSVAGAEKGEAAAQIPQDKLQEGIDTFGEKNENYEYLTVTVNLTNSGSAEAEAYPVSYTHLLLHDGLS